MNTDKIGLIGDIPANDLLLEKAADFLSQKQIPIFCTGDLPGEAGNVSRCIEILKKNNIQTVFGKHDEWLEKSDNYTDEDFSFIKTLEQTKEFDTAAGPVLLCHGIGKNNMSKINPDDFGYAIESNYDFQRIAMQGKYKIILNGHSHKKIVKKVYYIVIINAGSLVNEHGAGFLEIDFKKRKTVFYSFDDQNNIIIEKTEKF